MFKFLALIALLVLGSFAQDINTVSDTTNPLADVPQELAALVDAAPTELEDRVSFEPSAEQIAAFNAAVIADPQIGNLALLAFAGIAQILPVRDASAAIVATATADWNAYKAQVVANVTTFLASWNEMIANKTAERDQAVDSVKSLLERARAVFYFNVAKIAQRVIAAKLVQLRLSGELTELKLKGANGAIFIMNNSIAALNGSMVGDINWTPIAFDTVKAKLIDLAVAIKVAEFRLAASVVLVAAVEKEAKDAYDELVAKVQAFANQVYTAVSALKTQWKATAGINVTLAARVEAFLENVTGVEVTITGLDGTGNVSVTIGLNTVNVNAQTAAAIKLWLVKHIQALLVAYTGAKESEVSTSATETVKRGTNAAAYAVTSQIGSEAAPSNTQSSASSVIASVAVFTAAIFALVA